MKTQIKIEKKIGTNINEAEFILNQFKKDFNDFIDQRKITTHAGSCYIERSCGVHRRTVITYLRGNTNPTAKTIIKMYSSMIEDCDNLDEFLSCLPLSIFNFVEGSKELEKIKFKEDIDFDILKSLLKRCSVTRSIFLEIFQAKENLKVPYNFIEFEYGKNGIKKVEKLLDMKVVTLTGNDIKLNISLKLDEDLKRIFHLHCFEMGESTSDQEFKADCFEWMAGRVNEITFLEIQSILKESKIRVISLLSDPQNKGEVKFQTSLISEASNFKLKASENDLKQ